MARFEIQGAIAKLAILMDEEDKEESLDLDFIP